MCFLEGVSCMQSDRLVDYWVVSADICEDCASEAAAIDDLPVFQHKPAVLTLSSAAA